MLPRHNLCICKDEYLILTVLTDKKLMKDLQNCGRISFLFQLSQSVARQACPTYLLNNHVFFQIAFHILYTNDSPLCHSKIVQIFNWLFSSIVDNVWLYADCGYKRFRIILWNEMLSGIAHFVTLLNMYSGSTWFGY